VCVCSCSSEPHWSVTARQCQNIWDDKSNQSRRALYSQTREFQQSNSTLQFTGKCEI